MRLSSLLIALFGLVIAGGSVYAAKTYLDAQQVTQTEESATVTVVVAGRDIGLGQPIERHMLTIIDWPRDSVPSGVYTDLAVLLDAPIGQPRRAMRAISQGELILENRVSKPGEKVTIVQTLAPGHRAMAIEVEAETAVGGFVTPGNFVDVVLTYGRDETLRAVTILQNVRVVGVDQESDQLTDRPEIARTVTLEVDPDESQRLALAQQAGTLSLTLRTEDTEGEDQPLQAVRLSDILQEESPAPAGEARPVIQVRRGNVVETTN